jgi:hypothetical protein
MCEEETQVLKIKSSETHDKKRNQKDELKITEQASKLTSLSV